MIINYAKRILRQFKLLFNYWKESNVFFLLLLKHNASINTDKNKEKMQYVLLRETHVIEKGMSMQSPRRGFGQEKVLILIRRLERYLDLYKDKEFLNYPLSTIRSYIEYTKGNEIEIPIIEAKYEVLCRVIGTNSIVFTHAGTKEVSKDEIWRNAKINFQNFVNSRHSIRYFSKEYPDRKLIDKALEIAQRTPSACNRQGWKVYVFSPEKTYSLLKWQEGANGFEQDIPLAILVTTNLNAFLFHEPYQAYVDGGMYAMSLLYALHSLGLGTIPLSTGFQAKKIRDLHARFNIPENEVPIVIIGTGCLLGQFNVAVSQRKSILETTNYRLS